MVTSTVVPDDVVALAVAPSFRRREARETSTRVRDGIDAGERRFILDLTASTLVDEAPLIFMLLGLRGTLQRRSAGLVVASARETARRLDANLRLDDVIAAVASRDGALARVRTMVTPSAADQDGIPAFDHRFEALPGSVAEARRALQAWLAAHLTGQDRLSDAIVIATSEACNNAVLHAYHTSSGNGTGRSFRVAAHHRDGSVHVAVSDDGDGMTPKSRTPGLGLGLPIIAGLSDAVDYHPSTRGRGTVVAMRFDGAELRAPTGLRAVPSQGAGRQDR